MKILFIILAVFCVVVIVLVIGFFYRLGKPVDASRSDSYYHHAWKKKIIYSPMGNWFELAYEETTADPATFTVLSRDYGKDSQSVFLKGKPQQVDLATFQVDGDGIPRDQFHVYYETQYPDSLVVIEEADPKTYRPYAPNKEKYYQQWGQDERSVFLEGKRMDVDRNTFFLINQTLAMDSAHLYIIYNDANKTGKVGATQVIKKANHPGGKAEAINSNYARVGNSILLSNWKNEFAIHTFRSIDSIRVVDDRNIVVDGVLMSDGKIIPELDLATFEVVDRDFMKDKNNVYYDTKKIHSCDPQSFATVFEEYSKDKTHVFYQEHVLEGADPDRFTYDYATGIASDGKLFFKNGKPVTDKP